MDKRETLQLPLRGLKRFRIAQDAEAFEAGGFGKIFTAVDLLTDKKVILKRQTWSKAADRELRSQLALQAEPHQSVLSIIDSFVTEEGRSAASQAPLGDRYFLYTASVLYPTTLWHKFRTPLVAAGEFGFRRTRRYAVGLFRGADHLHRVLGIVHGDLSLKNIFISGQDEAVIADFGSARSAMDIFDGAAGIALTS